MSVKRAISAKVFIEDLQLAEELIKNFSGISILNNLFTTMSFDSTQRQTDLMKIEQLYRQKRQEKIKAQEEQQKRLEEERNRLEEERKKIEEKKRITKNMAEFLQELKNLEIRIQQNKAEEEMIQFDTAHCKVEKEKTKEQKELYRQERKERIIANAKKKGYIIKEKKDGNKIKLILQRREF